MRRAELCSRADATGSPPLEICRRSETRAGIAALARRARARNRACDNVIHQHPQSDESTGLSLELEMARERPDRSVRL
jgi:hypothetical protein